MAELFNMKQFIKNIADKLSRICLPSKLYIAFGLFLIILTLRNKKKTLFVKILSISYIGLISFIFDILCKQGYGFIVWFLLILPFIMVPLIILITTINFAGNIKNMVSEGRFKKGKTKPITKNRKR